MTRNLIRRTEELMLLVYSSSVTAVCLRMLLSRVGWHVNRGSRGVLIADVTAPFKRQCAALLNPGLSKRSRVLSRTTTAYH